MLTIGAEPLDRRLIQHVDYITIRTRRFQRLSNYHIARVGRRCSTGAVTGNVHRRLSRPPHGPAQDRLWPAHRSEAYSKHSAYPQTVVKLATLTVFAAESLIIDTARR